MTIIYMVVPEDDVTQVLGYMHANTIYPSVAAIPVKRSIFHSTTFTISADLVYIQGKGMANLAALRAAQLERYKFEVDMESVTDPRKRALRRR